MGAGAAVTVLGYRIALIITGSLALILADYLPWSMVYLMMAGLMAVCILFSLFAQEPPLDNAAPNSLREAVVRPFIEFFERLGVKTAVLALLLIVLYKLGDALVNNMVTLSYHSRQKRNRDCAEKSALAVYLLVGKSA